MSRARTSPWRRGATHHASRRSVAAKPVRRSSSGTATIASSPPSSAAGEHSDRARAAQGSRPAGLPGIRRIVYRHFSLDAAARSGVSVSSSHTEGLSASRARGVRDRPEFDGMGESRRTNRAGRGTRRRRTEGSVMAKASPPDQLSIAGLRATVVRLGDMSTQLAGRLWDDAQTLVRGRTPREAASRLAAGALDASAEARRQAEELLRRLGGQSSRLVAVLESDVARLTETITEPLRAASRHHVAGP